MKNRKFKPIHVVQKLTYPYSIIFSCWTRSLDLVGIFLKSRDIDFVRIDGTDPINRRKWKLENFQKQPELKILLMTTGTGSIG
jgi:SNF2 family DNA or RNA helicase